MSTQFSIMRKIEIDMAHRIPDHASKCRTIHGHRYVIEAHCAGELADSGSENGMVMDFSFLKDEMIQHIHTPFDHGMVLCYNDPTLNKFINEADLKPIANNFIPSGFETWAFSAHWLKLVLMRQVPTAENLARLWYTRLDERVVIKTDGRANLTKVVVHETPNCTASFPA